MAAGAGRGEDVVGAGEAVGVETGVVGDGVEVVGADVGCETRDVLEGFAGRDAVGVWAARPVLSSMTRENGVAADIFIATPLMSVRRVAAVVAARVNGL